MASTPIDNLIYQVRTQLREPIPAFWSDNELVTWMNNGARILYRAIVDLYQDYFNVIDESSCFIEAGQKMIWGIPEDVYKVVMIEPRVLGEQSTTRGLIFKPRGWTDPAFVQARARPARPPQNTVVYYTLMKAGAPVGPPEIRIAPVLTDGVLLTVTYVHAYQPFCTADRNPIPGESDAALVHYTLAHALAKERGETEPDAAQLALFGTERTDILTRLDIRQLQESQVALGMFEGVPDEESGWGDG